MAALIFLLLPFVIVALLPLILASAGEPDEMGIYLEETTLPDDPFSEPDCILQSGPLMCSSA